MDTSTVEPLAAARAGPISGDFPDAFDISLSIKVKSANYRLPTIPEGVCDRVLG